MYFLQHNTQERTNSFKSWNNVPARLDLYVQALGFLRVVD